MKRYDMVPDDWGYACMEERPTGDYIRHDDADLAALVAAAEEVAELPTVGGRFDRLRAALAAVAGTDETRGA